MAAGDPDRRWPGKKRLNICMVTDFFYPSMGGVENHVYQLSQCLVRLGHKVVVVSHRYGDRCGVRFVTGGLKVYYIPFLPVYDRVILPTGIVWLPLFRDILARERIDLVHCHAVSTMAAEGVIFAFAMGYHVIYTEHSNYGFTNVEDIHINKMQQLVLRAADLLVAVSHCTRENLCLRAQIDPRNVFVIPNALDTTQFRPDPDNRHPANTVNIVVISRLVWRKGTHLLVDVVPEVCAKFPYVHFIIAGDGPKRLSLEEMREKHRLQDRVELLGEVPHAEVASVLTRGHIFLNTSLTEAFCIAILEAVSCGLVVVSTRVGGVPEILPRQMLNFAEPEPAALVEALSQIIPFIRRSPPPPFHSALSQMYSWMDVARRTEFVYTRCCARATMAFVDKMRLVNSIGPAYGKVVLVLFSVQWIVLVLLEWFRPVRTIARAADFPAGFLGS